MSKVVVIKRKFIITWLVSWFVLFALVVGSFQYTNYVDRRSNRHWCNIVHTFNETYKKEPPSTGIGKILQKEFKRLEDSFSCK